MSEEEKELSGQWFLATDEDLQRKKLKAHRLSHDFNNLYEEDVKERETILKELLFSLGEGSTFIGPIFFHYGSHTRIGKNCYMNTNFTVQDDAYVTIGDNCRFGPNCSIVTPLHPFDKEERRTRTKDDGTSYFYASAKPVTIGNGCWFGAGVIVTPGVTIGDGCIIGAGSVVTHDIKENTLAYGVPCQEIRTITKEDLVNLDF